MPSSSKQTPVDNNFEDDEKMLNDDIDRLVAEMQAKPYDSSRYQEEG